MASPAGVIPAPDPGEGVAPPVDRTWDEASLSDRWAVLCGAGPASEEAGARLTAAWAEGHRRYHTTRHLSAVLDHLDELDADGRNRSAHDRHGRVTGAGSVRVAAWYHDAVYVPSAGDNKAASARMAREALPVLGWDDGAVDEVARLVLLTVAHLPDGSDRAGALLCDADLAVLGSDPAGYGRYVDAVRAEHADVDDDGWRVGRGAVLAGLLARDRLYVTSEGARRWEIAARDNLAGELRALTG